MHTLSGDLTKSRVNQNLLAGFWAQLKMNKNWTAQTELLLIDKGIGGTIAGNKSPHWVNLHYFEVPFLFQYHQKKMYYEFGPGLAYLINCAEHLYGNNSPDLKFKYPFAKNEISFNLGIGCTLNEYWSFEFRLNHSLLPVRAAVPTISKASYNRLLAFSVTRLLKKKNKSDAQ